MSAAPALMSGPTSTAGSSPEPEPQLARPRLEALEQGVHDRALDDDPRRGRAALAGRPEGRPQDPVRREVEIGVGEDDDTVLAAELERDALEAATGAFRDALAGQRRTGERDDRDIGAVDEGVADLRARTSDEVDDAGREAGLRHQLDEERGAMGRVGGRLEDHGVPGHESRHRLPARDRHREVPGRDDPGHAERLADAHRPLVRELRGDRVAGHPPPSPAIR